MMMKIDVIIGAQMIINTSPIIAALPILYRMIGHRYNYSIPLLDIDRDNSIRCGWATNNVTQIDECALACHMRASQAQHFLLDLNSCTLSFVLTDKNEYPIAIQIEDFSDRISSVALSSTPLQFVIRGVNISSDSTSVPVIIGVHEQSGSSEECL
jgi:hypothetical protein